MEDLKDEGECESDAVPVPKVVKKILSGRSLPSQTVGRSEIRKDAREYKMNHRRRGRAVVFNQINFSSAGWPKRHGAETDGENLTQTLSALGFTVDVYVDRQSNEIEAILKEVQKDDHSDADCVLVAMLSHGDEEGFLYDSRGWKFLPSKLWTPFTADLCTSLAGKPKMFLVQACQGDVVDGVEQEGVLLPTPKPCRLRHCNQHNIRKGKTEEHDDRLTVVQPTWSRDEFVNSNALKKVTKTPVPQDNHFLQVYGGQRSQ